MVNMVVKFNVLVNTLFNDLVNSLFNKMLNKDVKMIGYNSRRV